MSTEKIIKKWHIDYENITKIVMSDDAKILHVSEQYVSHLVMWVLDYDHLDVTKVRSRTFRAIPTGRAFSDDGHTYIGTAVLHDGAMVAHVFEVANG